MKHLYSLFIMTFILVACEKDKANLSSENMLIDLKINNVEIKIEHESNEIFLTWDENLDMTNVIVSVKVSEKSTVKQNLSEPIDLNYFSQLEISAENGDVRIYSISSSFKPKFRSFKLYGNEATIEDDKIKIGVYKSSDISELLPQIIIPEGTTIEPNIEKPLDFSSPINFTLTNKFNESNTYTTELYIIPSLKSLYLEIDNNLYVGEIIENKAIFNIPFDLINKALTKDYLKLTYELNDNFQIEQNYSFNEIVKSFNINLIDPIGNEEVVQAVIKNTDNFLYSFTYSDQIISGNYDYHQLYYRDYPSGISHKDYYIIQVWANRDITNIIPDYSISENASIDADLSIGSDFTNDRVFTITSESGLSRTYVIRFIKRYSMIANDWNRSNRTGYLWTLGNFFIHYRSYAKVSHAWLVDPTNNSLIDLDISGNNYTSENEEVYVIFRTVTPVVHDQYYSLKLKLEDGVEFVTNSEIVWPK